MSIFHPIVKQAEGNYVIEFYPSIDPGLDSQDWEKTKKSLIFSKTNEEELLKIIQDRYLNNLGMLHPNWYKDIVSGISIDHLKDKLEIRTSFVVSGGLQIEGSFGGPGPQTHFSEYIALKPKSKKKEIEKTIKISEKIICSANWYKDLPTPVYKPNNIEKGIVFCGHRHVHCLHQMIAITGKRQCEAGEEIQGFLTDTNRFVDREEAAKIAIGSGQIKKLKYSSKHLYSEDLY